jgi:ribosome-binding ATPase
MLSVGIVGLPNAGKSLLFNTITNLQIPSENYPFCTIEPNSGKVEVMDDRLDSLSSLFKPEKTIRSVIEFVDIAGIVRGASEGAGLGNKFLANIRETDLIFFLLRAFENDDIIHTEETVDPARDFEALITELYLADMETCNKRLQKLEKEARGNPKLSPLADKLKALISKLSGVEFINPVEFKDFKNLQLFSMKPFVVGLNINDTDNINHAIDSFISSIKSKKFISETEDFKDMVLPVAVLMENEISSLGYDERKEFYDQMSNYEGLRAISKKCFNKLGLISFFTAGADEVRSWETKEGSKAPQAAGKIHTDFEKKFIRANVIHWNELLELGSFAKARDAGKLRVEGKDYTVKDGDVLEIMHG